MKRWHFLWLDYVFVFSIFITYYLVMRKILICRWCNLFGVRLLLDGRNRLGQFHFLFCLYIGLDIFNCAQISFVLAWNWKKSNNKSIWIYLVWISYMCNKPCPTESIAFISSRFFGCFDGCILPNQMCILIFVVWVWFHFNRFFVFQFSLLFFFESLQIETNFNHEIQNLRCFADGVHFNLPIVRICVQFQRSNHRRFVVLKFHLRTVHDPFYKQQYIDRYPLLQNLWRLGRLFEQHHV